MADEPALVASDGRLRADLVSPALEVVPGEPVEVTVRVLNASSVIETVFVRVAGLLPDSATVSPSSVQLFPEESVEVTIELRFPATLPAGTHEGLILVTGASGHVAPAEVTFGVTVLDEQRVTLTAEPPVRTGRRKARFALRVDNVGNTTVRAQVRATDAERTLKLRLDEPVRLLHPGFAEAVELVARGRQPWTGAPVEHLITIQLRAGDVTDTTEVRFRQKPRLTAGVITLLTLALIGVLWALAMLFGVSTALAPPAPTKELPASFSAGGVGLDDLDPTAVGGTVAGTVAAVSTAQPVARVTVEAFDTQGRLVGATATGDDGTFELDSLLPSRYRLRIHAPGFAEQWWPDAPDPSGATLLAVSPTEPVEGIDVRLAGEVGTLGGQVIAGDGGQEQVTVEVQPLDAVGDAPTLSTVTDGDGVWSIGGLTAPVTYRVVYRAAGYAPAEVTQPLEAGQQVVVNTVRLPAAAGAITGLVVDRDGTPLGGVEIEAQGGEAVVATTTPTAGEIGTFQLADLATPATYLLTFRAEGRASETRAVRLGPGESLEGLEIALAADTGVITGTVVDASGAPLGGVGVTVSGGDTVLSTETLTSGQVGHFRLTSMPVPGVYAVTFELAGHSPETVQAVVSSASPTTRLEVELGASLGRIAGLVLDGDGDPLGATTIEVSDGLTTRTTTTASEPAGRRGRFVVEALEPGSYTITARTTGGATRTLLRTVEAGGPTNVRLTVGGLP